MNSEIFQNFLSLSRTVFYANLFTLGCQLIVIFISLFLLKKEKLAVLFLIYSCAAFSLFIINQALLYPKKKEHIFLAESGNIIFALIEYILFFIYFRHILFSVIVKRIMKFFLILLAISVFIYFLYCILKSPSDNVILKFSDFIISSELIFLAGFCLVYYFESFHKKITSGLRTSPSFWIVKVLFIYSILIAPFFMISEEMIEISKKLYHIAFVVHFISFGFLFLAISKALLMKKSLTQ